MPIEAPQQFRQGASAIDFLWRTPEQIHERLLGGGEIARLFLRFGIGFFEWLLALSLIFVHADECLGGLDGRVFRVLGAAEVGMGLTESLAMTPASSVSGFYLAHRQAQYFNVGTIGADQLADWAARNAMSQADARRALAPVLGM